LEYAVRPKPARGVKQGQLKNHHEVTTVREGVGREKLLVEKLGDRKRGGGGGRLVRREGEGGIVVDGLSDGGGGKGGVSEGGEQETACRKARAIC